MGWGGCCLSLGYLHVRAPSQWHSYTTVDIATRPVAHIGRTSVFMIHVRTNLARILSLNRLNR